MFGRDEMKMYLTMDRGVNNSETFFRFHRSKESKISISGNGLLIFSFPAGWIEYRFFGTNSKVNKKRIIKFDGVV